MNSRLAHEVAVIRDRSLDCFAPADCDGVAAREFGLRFASARAAAPLRELRECLEILGMPEPTYRDASELAGLVGRYALEDSLALRLKHAGVELGPEGEVPYTAALDFLSPERYRISEGEVWSVDAIRAFLGARELELVGWRLDPATEYSLSIVLHAGGSRLDCWRALDALDALGCHRRTHLELWVRRADAAIR